MPQKPAKGLSTHRRMLLSRQIDPAFADGSSRHNG